MAVEAMLCRDIPDGEVESPCRLWGAWGPGYNGTGHGMIESVNRLWVKDMLLD